MSVKVLTEHHLEFLSLKGGCTGSSMSTLVEMPHCWKSHVVAQLYFLLRVGVKSSCFQIRYMYIAFTALKELSVCI